MEKMKLTYRIVFRILGAVAPLFLLLDFVGFIPQVGNDLLRLFGYLYAPVIALAMFVLGWKILTKKEKFLGLINIIYFVFQIGMLAWFARGMSDFN